MCVCVYGGGGGGVIIGVWVYFFTGKEVADMELLYFKVYFPYSTRGYYF